MSQLPQWKSHKVVLASKILDVTRPPGDDQPYTLHLADGSRVVDRAWCIKHCTWNPTAENAPISIPNAVGGYFVEYADGYSSWSPGKAFEDGYECVQDDQGGVPDAVRGNPTPETTATEESQQARRERHAELEDRQFLLECTKNGISGACEALRKIVKQIDARLKAD